MKVFLLAFFIFVLGLGVNAQNSIAPQQSVETILNEQFSNLKSASRSYKDGNRQFKVIEVNKLGNFWNGILETVKNHENTIRKAGEATGNNLQQAQATIGNQTNQIAVLKRQNALQEKEVQQNASEVNNISVLGAGINKQVFLIFSFGSIILLLALAGIMASRYKTCKVVTDEKTNAFQAMEQEFNEFKKAARERELKIKRELQTELNFKEELKKQLASLQS